MKTKEDWIEEKVGMMTVAVMGSYLESEAKNKEWYFDYILKELEEIKKRANRLFDGVE